MNLLKKWEQSEKILTASSRKLLFLTSFILKHNLSKKAGNDLTKLVNFFSKNQKTSALSDILPHPGKAKYNLFHYYGKCGHVIAPINSNDFQCKTVICNGLRYKASLNKQQEGKYPRNKLLITDIKISLKNLLEKKEMWNVIAHRVKIVKERNNHEMIFAKEYQKLSKEEQIFCMSLTLVPDSIQMEKKYLTI